MFWCERPPKGGTALREPSAKAIEEGASGDGQVGVVFVWEKCGIKGDLEGWLADMMGERGVECGFPEVILGGRQRMD